MIATPILKQLLKRFLAPVPPGLRQPLAYWHMKRFLSQAQWWDASTIRDWQFKKLKEIITFAYSTVPGYQELYRQAGFKPDDFQSLGCLERLPFVTKELIRDNIKDFTSHSFTGRQLRYITTGGSTGIPFGFNLLSINTHIERAFMHSGWERAGWRLGDASAVLRGSFVGGEGNHSLWDPFNRELLLSSYFLTAGSLSVYLSTIQNRKPLHLQAYPSSLALLSDLVLEVGVSPQFKVLLLGSENLYEGQKHRIRQAFPEAKIHAWYGHAEQAVLAAMCEHSEAYHVWPFYGFTEILDPNNRCSEIGTLGELVGTSFWCRATPFIRYRTMDLAQRGPDKCQLCGRHFPLLNHIEGRLQEIIVTGTGRYISMTAINMHDDIFDPIRQFQFFQDQPGKVVFNYIPKAPMTEYEIRRIEERLAPKFGRDTQLVMNEVGQIARTSAGKFRFLDQRLAVKYGDR